MGVEKHSISIIMVGTRFTPFVRVSLILESANAHLRMGQAEGWGARKVNGGKGVG